MRVSVEKLRRWLLLGAVAIVVVLVATIGYARYRARRILLDLPKRLGADIRSETNGFTYSQSVKGRTVFTVHAAKAIQRQDGLTTLHDVAIILYGNAPAKGETPTTDRIYGREFEYDQANSTIRAIGEVQIDLQAPTPGDPSAAVETARAGYETNDGRMHVKTSALVFAQKQGVAVTDQPIEFHLNETRGNAVGAEYDSGNGLLTLRHDVHMHRLERGSEATLLSDSAEMDRNAHVANLVRAQYLSAHGNLSADHLKVDLRQNGSPEKLHGDGNVTLVSGGSTVHAPHGEATISEANHPEIATLTGGVTMSGDAGTGSSHEAEVRFDEHGDAKQTTLTGDVRAEQMTPLENRTLSAERVVMQMDVADGRSEVRSAVATGSARMVLRGTDAKAGQVVSGQTVTTMTGDVLTANVAGSRDARWIRSVTGTGNAQMERTLADGSMRRVHAQTLTADLRQPVPQAKGRQAPDPVQHATGEGGVVLVDRVPSKGKQAASETHANSDHLDYEGTAGVAVLTGSPRVEQDGMQMTATRITVFRAGDANADGDVKGSNASPGHDTMHVLAAHAEMHRATQNAIFTGTDARLWQGASMIEAPRIEMQRASQVLLANASAGRLVRASFAGNPSENKPKQAGAGANGNSVTRVSAQSLVYNGAAATPTARFHGGVHVEQSAGTIDCDQLTATLHARTDAQKATPATVTLGGNVETMLAEGRVRLQQPERSGSGEHLLYTAATGEYQLTGSASVLPQITDLAHGTVMGSTLTFHAGDNSVVVTASAGSHVRTETRTGTRPGRETGR